MKSKEEKEKQRYEYEIKRFIREKIVSQFTFWSVSGVELHNSRKNCIFAKRKF